MSQVCYNNYPAIANSTHSGINILGEILWGSHFCQFYENTQDLLDVLVLYFMEGLSNNEVCYWSSADEEEHSLVYQGLKKNVPGLDELISQGKISLSIRQRPFTKLLAVLLGSERKALSEGFSGVRAAGSVEVNTSQENWEQYIEFEAGISKALEKRKITVLCCFSLQKHNSVDLLSIIKNHEFSLVRCRNEWELLEKSSIKTTKNQLHKINQELEQRVNERTEILFSALQARDKFLAIATHELKTPIAALRLYTDGLLRSQSLNIDLPEKTKYALKKIQEQTLDLEALLNNLLDVTSFQKAGLLAIHVFPLNLAELVKAVIERTNEKYSDQRVFISLEAPESLLGQWDGLRLQQVIKNLLENALKYSSNQPVTVTLSKKNNRAILSVKDKGIGIAKIDQEEIFERFIQLSNKKFVGGFGLGLWIVKKIVNAHKGLIKVKSELGQGAEFIVSLPLK